MTHRTELRHLVPLGTQLDAPGVVSDCCGAPRAISTGEAQEQSQMEGLETNQLMEVGTMSSEASSCAMRRTPRRRRRVHNAIASFAVETAPLASHPKVREATEAHYLLPAPPAVSPDTRCFTSVPARRPGGRPVEVVIAFAEASRSKLGGHTEIYPAPTVSTGDDIRWEA